MNRAARDRQRLAPELDKCGLETGGTVSKDKLWLFQTACIEIAEEHAPRGLAFPAYILDGQQHLLPVSAHPYSRQNRDVRSLSIQTGLDDRAIQNQTDDIVVS